MTLHQDISQHPLTSRRVQTAARVSAVIFGGFAALQTAMVLGAPLGEHFWGGNAPATLTAGWRVASATGAVLLIGMARVVLTKGGVVRAPRLSTSRWLNPLVWLIVAYMTLNTVGNLAGSPTEQYVFAPVTAVAAMLTALVAKGGRPRLR